MTILAHPRGRLRAPVAATLIALATLGAARAADRAEALPKPLEGVGIDQLPGAPLPLDARFIDENGQGVALGDLLKSGRPAILDLGYYGCPMLCGLVLNAMLDGIRPLPLLPGQDFEIIVVSIDRGIL